MKKYCEWVLGRWRPLLVGLVMLLFMVALLGFRLGILNNGATASEINYLWGVHTGANLLQDPTFLIHKIPTYVLYKLGIHSIAVFRLVSGLFAGITVISSFILLRKMHTTRVAFLGAGLLLTSAWLLHTGRSATPEASLLLLLPLILIAIWLHGTNHHHRSLLTLALTLVVSFYIPGFWWLAIMVIIWERRAIRSAVKSTQWWFAVICGIIIIAGLIPLVWAGWHTPRVLLAISGLPQHLPTLKLLANNFVRVPKYLFVSGPNDPARWLGRVPILDIFSAVMLILGIYSLRFHLKQNNMRFLLVICLMLVLLVTVGGLTSITALIPLLYVIIGAGIAFMLQQWMAVFPHNPLARNFATTLMSIAIALVAYYHINHYFIAWPQTPATKQVFNQKL